MANTYPQKRFHYKEADVVRGNKSLQDLIAESFTQYSKPSRRTQKLAGEDDHEKQRDEVVVMYRTTHRGMLCGVLQRSKPGAPVIAAVMSDEAENYELRKFELPKDLSKKERAEVVKNLLYFAIRENHVILTQAPGFDARNLQDHLGWLIRHRCQSAAEKDAVLLLKDHVPLGYRGGSPKGVRSISIRTEPGLHPAEGSGQATNTKDQKWVIENDPLVEAVLKVLKNCTPKAAAKKEEADVLTLADAYKKGSLRARLSLEIIGADKNQSPLDFVANDLLATEGLEWEMELPRKEPFRSKDAKISRKYGVRCSDDVIDPKSAFEKMASMIEELIKEKKILVDV